MAKSTWDMVSDRIQALGDLNDRQDKTAELLHWDDSPYQLVKPDGTTKLADSISVTPNLPKVFAHGVIADLMGGKWQTVIEGVGGRQSNLIEQFVDDNFNQADEYLLSNHGIPSLFGWLCNHVCVRWAIGVRWIAQVVKGEYKIDCLPVDMRWTPFVLGKWVCPIFYPSKEDLEQELAEYEKKPGFKMPPIGTDNETRDFWGIEEHEFIVSGQTVFKEKNTLGVPPFVIVTPATGFMLMDKGYLKHRGEDILFLNASLYKELARSISLEQTSGYAGLYPAYEREVEVLTGEPSLSVPKIDESLDVKKGERHNPIPRGDINRAGQTARVDIQEMISNGAPLSPRQYNTPPSAVLLAGETEMISRLQNARKDALGIMRSQLARMMIKQFIGTGKSDVSIGKTGRKSKYSAVRLGDPETYTIDYHLSVKSKRQELANLAEFDSAYGKLPLKWNLTNVLMVDDPDGIIRELEIERAKQADPAIGLGEMGIQYALEAEDMDDGIEKDLRNFQSMLLIERAVSIVNARLQPAQPALPQGTQIPQVEQPKADASALSALAAQPEGGGGRPPPNQPPTGGVV